MGIFDECVQPKVDGQSRGGKVDAVLNSLSKEDKESLLQALREESIPALRISNVLAKRNIQLGKTAITMWRSVNCGDKK